LPGQVRLIEDDTEAVLAVASGVEPEAGPHVPGVQCFEIRSQASVKRKGEGWAGPEARRPNLRGGVLIKSFRPPGGQRIQIGGRPLPNTEFHGSEKNP